MMWSTSLLQIWTFPCCMSMGPLETWFLYGANKHVRQSAIENRFSHLKIQKKMQTRFQILNICPKSRIETSELNIFEIRFNSPKNLKPMDFNPQTGPRSTVQVTLLSSPLVPSTKTAVSRQLLGSAVPGCSTGSSAAWSRPGSPRSCPKEWQ